MFLGQLFLFSCFALLFQFSQGTLDPNDQAILVDWYNSLTPKETLNWTITNDLCGQTGVKCDNSSPYQRITKLDISKKNLEGAIPTQLGGLTQLQVLYLNNNKFSGTIPTQLGSLPNLYYLYLQVNKLSGTIPTQLGRLTNLKQLYLYTNQLSGTIPIQLGNLTSLQEIILWNSQLSGPIPTQLGSLTNVQTLSLDGNQLSGTIPTQLGNLTNLYYLYLDSNQLNGTIPTQFGNSTKLQYLRLHNNQLSGTIPTQLGRLAYLYLASNYWDCPIYNYSSLRYNDYSISECECDSSCPTNRCSNEGQCSTRMNGNFNCVCLPGYVGNGIECSPCPENGYSFNETTCLSCPQNSTSELASSSILDCKCDSFNTYPDCQASTCLLCPLGFLLDDSSNSCQKIKCSTLTLNGSIFLSMKINETSTPNCLPNYYVFESNAPYHPIPNEKGEAICLLNNDTITASWNIIKSCEPSCLIRGCDNNQVCAKPVGEAIERCICAGYIGKYCEYIDPQGCDTLNCNNDGVCIDKTGTKAAYCNCSVIGYNGSFCEIDINECLTNNGGCDSNAICTNTPGSFSCECKSGYSGNGFNCSPSQNNQAIGIGVGVTFGLLALIILVLLILFLLRKNKRNYQDQNGELLPLDDPQRISIMRNSTIILGDKTLMNTKFELSIPGFMKIDFIDQIRQEEKIGGGGSAITYKGTLLDPKLRERFKFKEIAIKRILEDQIFTDEEYKLRFEQEISIIWAVSSHPNVITLVGYSENPRCIITKLYDQDLHKYIKNSTEDLSSEIILKFAKEIASGMSTIHSTGIVHRDLKTSNILLETKNHKMNAIICDFGLARMSSEMNVINQKLVNVKGFSPRYAAPEVFGRLTANATSVSIEDEMNSDIYSYAIILWEMMTRKIPWAHLKEIDEINFQIRSGEREEIPDCKGDPTLELISAIIELSWKQIADERPTFKQINQKLASLTC